MNEQNLIPNSQRTSEELREMGRKGGIKSGEIRRRNRELRKIARWILAECKTDLSELIGVFKHEQ